MFSGADAAFCVGRICGLAYIVPGRGRAAPGWLHNRGFPSAYRRKWASVLERNGCSHLPRSIRQGVGGVRGRWTGDLASCLGASASLADLWRIGCRSVRSPRPTRSLPARAVSDLADVLPQTYWKDACNSRWLRRCRGHTVALIDWTTGGRVQRSATGSWLGGGRHTPRPRRGRSSRRNTRHRRPHRNFPRCHGSRQSIAPARTPLRWAEVGKVHQGAFVGRPRRQH